VTSAFSAGGDTLYVVGSGGQSRATAAALHALDGAVLAVTELESPADNAVYVVIPDGASGAPTKPLRVYRFDRLPSGSQ
jgi:shikimate 5-dehydrogenase